MIKFAKLMLSDGKAAQEEAQITALCVRIMLDFDVARESSRVYEEKLVETHLRVVFAIPSHREFFRGGAPSEPLVAEAAAQILNSRHFQYEAPDVLAGLLKDGLLAQGQHGEMVCRLLWTIAHDLVIRRMHELHHGYDTQTLIYHRPILLLDWLKALINPRWHQNVLNAKPIADPHGPTLEYAFQDVYLNFSHFVRAGDYGVIHPNLQWTPLVRGMAYQCADNQKSTDLFVPAHHGGIDAPIAADRTAPVFGRVKNRVKFTDVLLNPHVGGTPINNLPILSLVHDIGLEQPNVYPHTSIPATELRDGVAPVEDIHVRHYQLHIEGWTNETYAVVPPEKSDVYKSILCATRVVDEFPRHELEGHRQAMLRLKPAFFSNEPGVSLEWISSNPPISQVKAEVPSNEVSKGKRKGPPEVTGMASSSVVELPQVCNDHFNRYCDSMTLILSGWKYRLG